MKKYAVITGGGGGLGRETAKIFSECPELMVLIVGRDLESLEKTQRLNPNKIKTVVADIATESGRDAIFSAIPHDAKISYLIHNAAILEPCKIGNISLKKFQYAFAVNLEGPVFLTQSLLPYMENHCRILHISSGFAHKAAAGLSIYCMSKAALYMAYQCFMIELAGRNIHIGSLSPGVIDTKMQENLRTTPEQIVPMSPLFLELKKENKLREPSLVAKFIKWVMFDTEYQQFSEKEWSINDVEHQAYWLNR